MIKLLKILFADLPPADSCSFSGDLLTLAGFEISNMENLSNGTLSIEVSGHGAELCSIRKGGVEYLWQADPEYWKRHSPVLFPIVGSLWNGVYRYGGKEYAMSQHGFARDMDFILAGKTGDEIWYRLEADDATLAKYPFRFVLEIGYRLEDSKVHVLWIVRNADDRTMYYQIGAHPAFYYPDFAPSADLKGYFSFGKASGCEDCETGTAMPSGAMTPVKDLEYILIREKGCADTQTVYRRHLEDGTLPIDTHTFDKDALILENGQVNRVTLHTPSGKPWLSLAFDAPEVGLWSPPYKNAPFVCIEPWYGRCDRADFSGDISERDWIQSLEAGETAEMRYTVEIL